MNPSRTVGSRVAGVMSVPRNRRGGGLRRWVFAWLAAMVVPCLLLTACSPSEQDRAEREAAASRLASQLGCRLVSLRNEGLPFVVEQWLCEFEETSSWIYAFDSTEDEQRFSDWYQQFSDLPVEPPPELMAWPEDPRFLVQLGPDDRTSARIRAALKPPPPTAPPPTPSGTGRP